MPICQVFRFTEYIWYDNHYDNHYLIFQCNQHCLYKWCWQSLWRPKPMPPPDPAYPTGSIAQLRGDLQLPWIWTFGTVRIFNFHLWTRLDCTCRQILSSTICFDGCKLQPTIVFGASFSQLSLFLLWNRVRKMTHPQQFWLRPAWPRNRLPPTRMVRMPSSQPGITCPVPTANSKGSPGLKVTGESWSLLIHKAWIIFQ